MAEIQLKIAFTPHEGATGASDRSRLSLQYEKERGSLHLTNKMPKRSRKHVCTCINVYLTWIAFLIFENEMYADTPPTASLRSLCSTRHPSRICIRPPLSRSRAAVCRIPPSLLICTVKVTTHSRNLHHTQFKMFYTTLKKYTNSICFYYKHYYEPSAVLALCRIHPQDNDPRRQL